MEKRAGMSQKPVGAQQDDGDDGFEVVPSAAGAGAADDDAFDLDELVKKGSGKKPSAAPARAPAPAAPRGEKRGRADPARPREQSAVNEEDDEEEFVGEQNALPPAPAASETNVAPETKRQRRKDAYRKRQQELEAETKQLSQSAVTCLLCGEEGHLSCNCPTHARSRGPAVPQGRRRTRSIICRCCGKNGHLAKDCPRAGARRGGPRGGRGPQRGSPGFPRRGGGGGARGPAPSEPKSE